MINAETLGNFVDTVIHPQVEKYNQLSNSTNNPYLKEWYKGQLAAFQTCSIKLNHFICKQVLEHCEQDIDEIKEMIKK